MLFLLSMVLWSVLIFFSDNTLIGVLLYTIFLYVDISVSLVCITLQYGGENFPINEKVYQICCGKCENIPHVINIKQ